MDTLTSTGSYYPTGVQNAGGFGGASDEVDTRRL